MKKPGRTGECFMRGLNTFWLAGIMLTVLIQPARQHVRAEGERHMKRIVSVIAAALMAVCLTACSGKFEVTESTGNRITLESDAAKAGLFMGMNFSAAEGEPVTIESNLTKGSIRVRLAGMANADNINEIPTEDETNIYEEVFEGITTKPIDIPAGEYICTITVEKKATGTISIYSGEE